MPKSVMVKIQHQGAEIDLEMLVFWRSQHQAAVSHLKSCVLVRECQEETQGGSDDERKGEKQMKMSDETRCKVQYKRVSTDLHRQGEPDQDMYVRKR